MEDKQNRTSLMVELLQRFAALFSQAVLIFTISGILIARSKYASKTIALSTLFAPDGKGLPYTSVLQLAGCSIIIVFFSMLLFSDYFQTKIPFFFRSFLLFMATLATSSIFAIIFKWYPLINIKSWLLFFLFAAAGFALMYAFIMLKLKLEGRKYNRLLQNYKARLEDN